MTETKDYFGKPDLEKDKKLVDEEAKRTKNRDRDRGVYFKPQTTVEEGTEDRNWIRVLPSKNVEGAYWYLMIGKHFIRHSDRTEVFICPLETYGKPCPACEQFRKMKQENPKSKEADAYRVNKRVRFNIIHRKDTDAGVQVYEAPRQYVGMKIITMASRGGSYGNLFDGTDKEGKEILGRDTIILFDKNAGPQNMYTIISTDPVRLGTPEQMKKWAEEMEPLILAKAYPEIDYETAKVKMFGTMEEREELRERQAKEFEDANKEESGKETSVEESKQAEKPEEETDEIAALEAKLAAAKAKKEEEKLKETKKEGVNPEEEKKSGVNPMIDKIKRDVARLRAEQGQPK